MATIYHGAKLTPHFDEFLPDWIGRQPWYLGDGTPALTPVGFYRFEDPAGAVGMQTRLLRAGPHLYQVPMTYRDAPLPGAESALITTAEHSVLGTRWIYDATADPVWRAEILRLVDTEGVSESGATREVASAEARGQKLVPGELTPDTVTIELRRVPTPGIPDGGLGLVLGTWEPDGHGCLAVLHPA